MLGLETLLAPLLGKLGSGIIDKIFPNKEAAEAAKLELAKIQAAGGLAEIQTELQIAVEQIKTNAVEASSQSLFKSGWRPAVGWVCVIGLIYSVVGANVFNVVLQAAGLPILPPTDVQTLITLLFGMLGLGYYRTKEKTALK
jgi:hypothetical protein